MPEKLDRCVKKLIEQGHSEDSAWAICQASINKKKTEKGVTKMFKKATVLKSMRTLSGAKDWAKAFSSRYEGELKIVDTDTLKHYDDFDGAYELVGMPNHVIIEEDLSPVVSVIKEGEIGEVVKALVKKGFMEIGAGGPCFTSKWYEAVDKYVASALEGAFKSVDEEKPYKLEFTGEVSELAEHVIKAVGEILKALEDAEKLSNLTPATENAEFGHELRAAEAISDEEVKSAEAKEAKDVGGEVDTSQMTHEAVSDEQVDTATHEGDHNTGETQKSSHGKEPNEVTQENVQGTDEPEALSDSAAADAVDEKAGKMDSMKEVDDTLPSSEEILSTTFKSMRDARAWRNPDKEKYEVVPTTFEDKKKFGRNKTHIVKERAPRKPVGPFGNRV